MERDRLRILILEDKKPRVQAFRCRFQELSQMGSPSSMTTTSNAKHCINLLVKDQYDVIFLASDLGGNSSGLEVAKFLSKRGDIRDNQGMIVIHDPDRKKRSKMVQHLTDAVEFPFVWTGNRFFDFMR